MVRAVMTKSTFALCLLLPSIIACGPGPRNPGGDDDDDGSNDGGGNGLQCSSDLHDVLDMAGNVVKTCGPTEGCSAGTCINACAAAAASKGSVGCDFVVSTPSFYRDITPPCFSIFLANNWPIDAAVTISRGAQTYDAATIGRVPNGNPSAASWPAVPASGIASSSVGVLFMSHDPTSQNGGMSLACPVAPAIAATNGSAVFYGAGVAQTGRGQAWHIKTSVPVSAYDILPYGGARSFLPSAQLLLPTSAWGTNYVAVSPSPTSGPGWGQIVASEDGTTVQISPSVSLPAGTNVAAAPAHVNTSYQLNAGEYVQWQDAGDMSGSIISSDKPVSFIGGTAYLCMGSATSSGGGCDSAHQLIPPVSALGFEYVAPPHATRRADMQDESVRYRVTGMVADTTLTFDPPIPGAPTSLSLGQVVEVESTVPFTVKSQDEMHPFYVGQYMAGCLTTSGSRPGANGGCLGDEEFVNVLPPAQWLSSYVFFTDPTYATTNLVLVRKKTANGFQDVTIDCLGVAGGWRPVASGSDYEITNVDLQRVTPMGTCTSGRHTATSAGPFNVMVWGLDSAASYAYPAGGNVGKINPVVVIL
jgi:hypothetical protein